MLNTVHMYVHTRSCSLIVRYGLARSLDKCSGLSTPELCSTESIDPIETGGEGPSGSDNIGMDKSRPVPRGSSPLCTVCVIQNEIE